MFEWLALLTIGIGSFYFIQRRLLRYLRFFQQHEYDDSRFIYWLLEQRIFDRKGSLIAIAAACIDSLTGFSLSIALLGIGGLSTVAAFEEDPLRHGKITLKMTERAKRIYRTTLFLAAGLNGLFLAISAWSYGPSLMWVLQALLFQSIPLLIVSANFCLHWKEQKRQKEYAKDAKRILAQVKPYVIGITGSYGKTSTKDALGQILQITLGPTFWPAKGVNSPMGITQEIRTKLKEGFRYAVVEMAAYGRGSVKRLCDLTPPHAGIITTVGTAHLERFLSEENIYLTKSELSSAVPKEGILVCNGDDAGARRSAYEHPKKTTLLYGFDNTQNDLDCWISSWKTTSEGTDFTLHWQGKAYQGTTPLFGRAALSNILAAFTMSCTLGSNPEYALAVIRNLEPIDNRLQVQRDGGIVYLRDAYNSNPSGFATALEVMRSLPGKRRILMTPGIIELGHKQHEENERIGRMAGAICDFAIVVGHTNREALKQGLHGGGLPREGLMICDNRDTALNKLASIRREGDIILIENDLPDLYEANTRF